MNTTPQTQQARGPESLQKLKPKDLANMAIKAFRITEQREGISLVGDRDRRLAAYDRAIVYAGGDPNNDELSARTVLNGELFYLSSQNPDQQDEAKIQFELGIDDYLVNHPEWANKTDVEKETKKSQLMIGFGEAVEEHNQNSQRLTRRAKTAAASGLTAVKAAFSATRNRIQSKFSREEVETVDINSLSNEELNSRYAQARKKYAKVVHQDTTRAFFKFRMPRTAKKAKEEFYALQSEFFNRNNKDELVAETNKTIAQTDYLLNLKELGNAQKNDKSPLYRSAIMFANSKLSSKIATSVATGFALKVAGGALAGVTAGVSIGVALAASRLRGVNNARFKEDADANYIKIAKHFNIANNNDFKDTLEAAKDTEIAELRKRMATAAGTTALFGAAGYGIGHLISASGIGEALGDGVDWVAKKANGVVGWLRDHTPLPDSKHFVGSVSHPSFSTKPSAGETLDRWRERISGGKGLTGEKAKAASKMFEIYQDPEKTKVFTGFLKQVSTPKGAMDFARMDSLIQNSPDPLKAAENFSSLMSNAPKPSTQALESAKVMASSIKSGLGQNGPSVIGNIQGYLQTTSSPSPETINSILRANHINGDKVIGFMSRNKSLAEQLFGKNWRNLFSK